GMHEGTVLPPLAIWKQGKWLSDLSPTVAPHAVANSERYHSWVVSGEGTPGNWEKRVYVLPSSETTKSEPRHPIMWPKEMKALKDGKPKSLLGLGWGETTKTQSSNSLPIGLRIRC